MLKKISYDKNKEMYSLAYPEDVKSGDSGVLLHLDEQKVDSNDMSKNNDYLPKMQIYSSRRFIGNFKYEISIFINLKGQILIQGKREGKKEINYEIMLTKNLGMYFSKIENKEFIEKAGKVIFDLLKVNLDGKIFINEAELRLHLAINNSDKLVKNLIKLQSKFRGIFSRVKLKEITLLRKELNVCE